MNYQDLLLILSAALCEWRYLSTPLLFKVCGCCFRRLLHFLWGNCVSYRFDLFSPFSRVLFCVCYVVVCWKKALIFIGTSLLQLVSFDYCVITVELTTELPGNSVQVMMDQKKIVFETISNPFNGSVQMERLFAAYVLLLLCGCCCFFVINPWFESSFDDVEYQTHLLFTCNNLEDY